MKIVLKKYFIIFLTVVLLPAISVAQSFQIQQLNSNNNSQNVGVLPWQTQQPVIQPSFQAYVDRQGVAAGQNFQIKLELNNADAHSAPDISALPSSIKIERQSQKSNFSMVNGVRSKSMQWIYDVLAEEQGTTKIPAISIETDQGTLYTRPFRIYVKDASELPKNTDDGSIRIESEVYNKEPFIDEPITYKARVYHLSTIEDAELVTPKSENAVIEQITEPNKGKKILNGVNYNIIEVTYSITPISSGEVTIEPTILRGKQIKRTSKTSGNSGSFDDFFDPFSMFDRGRSSRTELIPFTVASNKISLNVKEAKNNIKPWLALHDLKISSEFIDANKTSSGVIKGKVGEPINLKISLDAIGVEGGKLPNIENFISDDDFKIYADKPEISKKFEGNPDDKSPLSSKIHGFKTQTFTLIPQKSGKITIPEIVIPFWNLSKNKNDFGSLPEIKMNIMPSNNVNQNNYTPSPRDSVKNNSKTELSNEEVQVNKTEKFNFIYLVIILILIIALIALIIIVLKLKNKPAKEEGKQEKNNKGFSPRKINEKAENKFSLKKLEDSKNIKEFQDALQDYVQENLGISNKTGVTVIMQQVARKFNLDKAKSIKLASEIDYAIYSNGDINFEETKKEFLVIMKKVNLKLSKESPDSKKNKDSEFEKLNPEF